MRDAPLRIDGELYLRLETVAEIYRVRVAWLHEVCDHGLLGDVEHEGASICVAAVQLDRVATIVRLHHALGLELAAIVLALDED
ncbi:hypothetical protein Pla163_10610 [Planctomycetes bacterium Pla163]|uniref:Chaperone modulatory protein CbpM n=1 Tax=Rohdeia mirabilis TaxID=2528008 RepID=A0A518CXL3_9BACT|nr:hypothetical protein Pla163_10610 [Planctomycetes bacterium Pla163]